MCRMGCPETLITDWDEKIDTVLMGYRSSQQSSTKHSPYFMLFQQRMRLPNDNELLKILLLLTLNFCITKICTMTALSPALTPLYQKTSQW